MQIQKDEIRNRILIVARSEFIKNGVRHTSIKNIADKAGVAVGNVYNYYKGKDDLLKAVLAPLFKAFKDYRSKTGGEEYVTLDIFHHELYHEIMRQQVSSLIVPFRKEHYFDQLLEVTYTDGMTYLARIKSLFPHINSDISPHFTRILCDLWAGVIRCIVTHDDLTETEINQIITDYIHFTFGGWRELMGVE